MALAVVTGAGSGIGAAVSLTLAAEGMDLALIGRSNRIDNTRDAISATQRDVAVSCLKGDLAERLQRYDLIQAIQRLAASDPAGLTALIHAAGVGDPAPELARLATEDMERALAVNAIAPFEITRELFPELRGAAGDVQPARVVFVGAGVDEKPQPGTGSYGVSKLALKRLWRQMHVDLAHEATADAPLLALFQPGVVDTPGLREHIGAARDCSLPHAEYLQQILDAGQAYQPETVAGAITELLRRTPDTAFSGNEWRTADVLEGRQTATD